MNSWWTKTCSGSAVAGAEFKLGFGPDFQWIAQVLKIDSTSFELTFTRAMNDWKGTKMGFHLVEVDGYTNVEFYHCGWREVSEHFRTTSYCWAMYLRLLKRYVEFGEVVEYEKRLEV